MDHHLDTMVVHFLQTVKWTLASSQKVSKIEHLTRFVEAECSAACFEQSRLSWIKVILTLIYSKEKENKTAEKKLTNKQDNKLTKMGGAHVAASMCESVSTQQGIQSCRRSSIHQTNKQTKSFCHKENLKKNQKSKKETETTSME